jgi:hypothetical protein
VSEAVSELANMSDPDLQEIFVTTSSAPGPTRLTDSHRD